MSVVRVTSIVATTDPVEAYGGVRFHESVMHQVAEALRSGVLPMRFNHDATRPVSVSSVEAGVRQRADGEHEVWCEFDVDAEQWAAWEDYLQRNGAPGGMSISVTLPLGEFPADPQASTSGLAIRIAGDAYHFARVDLIKAAGSLSRMGPVQVGELMQFSHEPPALIVLGFLIDPGQQIAWGVLGNYVYDVLKRLRGDKVTAIHLEATEGERSVRAVIPFGTSDSVARAAIRAFENVATQSAGVFKYDESGGWESLDSADG